MKRYFWLLLLLVTFTSCKKEVGYVNHIESTYYVYRAAEYSDSEESWVEEISDTWEVYAVNDKVVDYTCPKDKLFGIRCKTPPVKYKYKKDYYFDRVSVRSNFEIIVKTTLGTYRSESFEEYLKLHEAMIKYEPIVFYTFFKDPVKIFTFNPVENEK